MINNYHLYGLKIRGPIILPWPADKNKIQPDIEIIPGKIQEFRNLACRKHRPQNWFYYYKLPDGAAYLRWTNIAEFLISPDSHTIKWYSHLKKQSESFQNYLLNQVLSFSLLDRGIEPLHGVGITTKNNEAIVFLGHPGYGKSTLAASFISKGLPLLTDDLVVLKENKKYCTVYPGLPRIKLFPRVSKRFLNSEFLKNDGSLMNPETSKKIFSLKRKICYNKPCKLKAIYLLCSPEDQRKTKNILIKNISPHQSFMGLIANTFNTVIRSPERYRNEFHFCKRIVDYGIPIKALYYPRNLKKLDAVSAAILKDSQTGK
ncbi:MAG: hypothetical protein IPM57_09605 [Oligoflexia bacterium]|nr:hypothetical protein [Oligoflexia bacterium]